MYATIETGGKQYNVKSGDVFDIERLHVEEGEEVTFDKVLLVSDEENITFGTPHIDGAKVTAKVVEQHRGKKLIVFKMKRRKSCRKKNGHRQELTKIEIKDIISA